MIENFLKYTAVAYFWGVGTMHGLKGHVTVSMLYIIVLLFFLKVYHDAAKLAKQAKKYKET